VVFLLSRSKLSITAFMLIILVTPLIGPLAGAGSNTQARASPDFSVTSFTLDGAGSVQSGTDILVENATHTVRIVVSNTGSASGTVVVSLFHQGSSSSGKSLVSSLEIGPIGAATSSSPVLIQWTATPGNGQSIFAEVFSVDDVNPGNDERRINFDVRTPVYLVGTVLDNSIPGPEAGQSEARIANTIQTFNATVINEGVRDITANFELLFTEVADPSNTKTFYSGDQLIEPGSLLIPPIASNLSTTFNAGLLSGAWQ